jgi:putative acetyltransferase
MSVTTLSNEFLRIIEEHLGAFDRPIEFRVFPFDAGGALNFLTIGRGKPFVTYVSWDLLGHEQQQRCSFGRYELLATCDDAEWCLDVLTNIGRQGLQEGFEAGDTFDIGPWVGSDAPLQGVIFEDAFHAEVQQERCGLLRCIGVTRHELEFAVRRGTPALVECLQRAGIYPRTLVHRKGSIELISLTKMRGREHARLMSHSPLMGDMAKGMTICQALTPQHMALSRALFQEYVAWLGIDLSFQGFPAELAGLPGLYVPPRGRLLLALADGEAAGCVALRPLGDGVCEMKRLFVRPAFRGQRLGKRLAQGVIAEAREAGYTMMRLDTLPAMQGAIRLYETLGFIRCAAYYETPLPDTIFMELRL